MIRRVSVWKLYDANDAQKMKEALLSMKGNVPWLYDIEVGVNISQHRSAFDIVFIGTFSDEASLLGFEEDAFHKAIGDKVNSWREKRVVVEYAF